MSQTTTIIFDGEDLDIDYYYEPAEPAVPYYKDGSGYPGCGEYLEIHEIRYQGEKLPDDYFDDDEYLEIEELTLKEIKSCD
jgi:hypothetical protein